MLQLARNLLRSLFISVLLVGAAQAQLIYNPGTGGGGGGSGTVTSVIIAGTVNQILAGGTCTITVSGTCTLSLANAVILGTDNSAAGTLQLADASSAAHTIFGSAATTSNTILGPATVLTNLHLFYCAVATTVCTLTDTGYAYNAIPNADLANSAITIAGTSVALGGATSSFPNPGAIGGGTPSTGAFTTVTATTSMTTGTAPVACGTATGCYAATEGTASNMTITASQDALAADATAHAFKMTLNGGAIFLSAMNASLAPTGTIAGSFASSPAGSKCVQSSGTAGLLTEAAGACGSSTPSLDQVTGSAAQATATETAISHEWTYAGIETANLTYPIVYQNTNATNTTSGALAVNVVGAGTAMVPLTINQPATDVGNIIQGVNGGTFTNGVLSGGTINWAITSTGAGLFGAATNPTTGTSGGTVAIEGTAFTGTSTNYGWYNDSTLHCLDIIDQTTNIGCAVGETSIIGANLLPKAVGTTSKLAASSITDNGTSVSTAENVVVGTAGGIPNVDKTIGFSASAMGAQTTATCTNITNMTWNLAANKNYLLECKIPMTLAATATIQYCLGGPGTATSYSLEADGDLGTAGIWSQISTLAQTAYGTKTGASAAVAANTIQHVSAAIQNGATASGTALTLQTAANGTNAITVGANATCTLTQAN